MENKIKTLKGIEKACLVGAFVLGSGLITAGVITDSYKCAYSGAAAFAGCMAGSIYTEKKINKLEKDKNY